jgi:hypothetical protein
VQTCRAGSRRRPAAPLTEGHPSGALPLLLASSGARLSPSPPRPWQALCRGRHRLQLGMSVARSWRASERMDGSGRKSLAWGCIQRGDGTMSDRNLESSPSSRSNGRSGRTPRGSCPSTHPGQDSGVAAPVQRGAPAHRAGGTGPQPSSPQPSLPQPGRRSGPAELKQGGRIRLVPNTGAGSGLPPRAFGVDRRSGAGHVPPDGSS